MIDLLLTLNIFQYLDANFLFQLFVNHADYLFVFLFMTVESSFIPFPSEVVVPPAAYIAVTTGRMDIFLIVVFATMGALVGATINYYLSMWLGRPIVYSFARSRFGHACLVTPEKVEKAEKYFDDHGAVSTFIGRLIPAVRQLISIPAGLARMNIWKFLFFTGLGALLWNGILAFVGYLLSLQVPNINDLFEAVEKYNTYLTIGGYSILAACILFIIYKALSAKPAKN